MKLDLGAGGRPREGFVCVDIVDFSDVCPSSVAFDLVGGDRWPWHNDSVDELASSHFIEHIPADYVAVMVRAPYSAGEGFNLKRVLKDRLLFFFDEAYRVSRPGALFHLTWPALKSTDAFRDPTHRRFLPLEFLHYLSAEGRAAMGLQHYEVTCNWVTVGDSLIHTEPLPEGCDVPDDFNRLWDVQRAFSVTLRAEK